MIQSLEIVLIRCPQPLLVGARTGDLYSSNRAKTPEPTLPQLEGILRDFSDRTGIPVKVTQLNLRYPGNGKLEIKEYGRVNLGYLEEPLVKTYGGGFPGELQEPDRKCRFRRIHEQLHDVQKRGAGAHQKSEAMVPG